MYSWAPTTPRPPYWQLPRRTTCITTAGDGGGNLKGETNYIETIKTAKQEIKTPIIRGIFGLLRVMLLV